MLNFLSSLYRRSRHRWIYPLISLTVALGLCLGVPTKTRAISWGDLILQGVQVIQLSNISDKKEVTLGTEINEQIKQQVKLYKDPTINEYVNKLGQRLAAKSARPNIPYTFQVVEDNGVNAFATMGGFVYVNTGLLKLADDEAQVASVVGHEIGHIARRHSIKQMRELAIARGIATAAGLDRNTAVGLGVELALRRPNSRKDEYEADQEGLKNMGAAGYAQYEMITFFQKLLAQSQGSVPTILSTHPDTKNRIARIQQAINPTKAKIGDGLDKVAYKAKIKNLL
ncbi:MAG: M48 family metalloprotease [Scytolyngbya sp. HA4215-MV1]|jgi:predicted Zn-dependent protease|nr:M48 family metalloprotease [Scytolyngbya sp. HA4215-MV1]